MDNLSALYFIVAVMGALVGFTEALGDYSFLGKAVFFGCLALFVYSTSRQNAFLPPDRDRERQGS